MLVDDRNMGSDQCGCSGWEVVRRTLEQEDRALTVETYWSPPAPDDMAPQLWLAHQ